MKEEGRTGDTSWLKVVRYGAALYNIWQGDQGKGKGETTVAERLIGSDTAFLLPNFSPEK